MADEGFEGYHVPQQSRRDKLRVVVAQNNSSSCSSSLVVEPLLPFYDSSSFITTTNFTSNQHNNNNQSLKQNLFSSSIKDLECSNFMMRGEGKRVMNISSSNSSTISHHPYLEHLNNNQGNIQVINSNSSSSNNNNVNNNNNNNPFFYQAQNLQNLRNFEEQNSTTMMLNHEPLSLSLSSHKSGSNLPLELNLDQRYGSMIYGSGGVIQGLVEGGGSGGSVPFTGYASVLKDSRFLKPAQQLLEEMCDLGGRGVCVEKVVVVGDSSLMMESPLERLCEEDSFGDHSGGEGRNKSRLLTMLDEVYKRYRQYYQQMQSVVTSFEYVSGLNNAAPYASLAIKSMSKHFRCLKKAITDQLQFNNKAHFHTSIRKDESPRFGSSERGGPYSHRSGFLDQQQPVWRPQRGLPERAVTVLRAWLFEHFLHPYPTDTDKIMLAKQTGLSRSQVSNWFINARVRLWKPMVEEIHMLETRQAPKDSQKEEHFRNKSNDHHLSSNTSLVSENPSPSTDKFHDGTYKRVVNEIPNISIRRQGQQQQQQMNLPLQQVGVGMSMGSGSSNNNNNNNNNNNSNNINNNSNVSLTLGLYQNHGIGLAEPFPLSAAQRFGIGLETNNEGYNVMSGFETQNRHFGRDVIGGQMFHDFVG